MRLDAREIHAVRDDSFIDFGSEAEWPYEIKFMAIYGYYVWFWLSHERQPIMFPETIALIKGFERVFLEI